LFKRFADYYGFNILACKVRKPQEKAKTKAGIKYVKYNFFAGRKFIDHQDLVFKLNDWLNNKCNASRHH
jgi:transposase